MALITIDPYYDIQYYNECKEALKNNGIEFTEFISTKPPFEYYFEIPDLPVLVNYDKVPRSYSKWFVSVVRALKPNDDYIYERRASYTGLKAINHYAVNDVFEAMQKSGECILFTSTKAEIQRLSKKYPRKIYYMGKYFNRKYNLFAVDKMIFRNYITTDQVLVESRSFKHITELEVELNFKIFHEKDRLLKLSETPYILDGKYYSISSARPEITDKFHIT